MKKSKIAALLAGLALLAGCAHTGTTAQASAGTPAAKPALHKLRFLMNSGYSGANTWFLIANQRGYFRDEGIEVEFTDGRGAFTAAGRMIDEGFDAGYGDIQATYEQAAKRPGQAPIGVYMVMDVSPSVIILPAASKVTNAKQLAGLTITGHGTDVALNTFEQFASKTGLDPASVKVVPNNGTWPVLIGLLDSHTSDALFGYLSTSTAAIHAAGQEVGDRLRFLKFRDAVPELYGSALMVSPRLLREQPEVARGLVRAINRGVMDAVCKPDEAIALLVAHDPKEKAAAERGRLMDTIDDMGGRDRILRDGVGDIDPVRMQAGLDLTVRTRHLPRQPALSEVFNRSLLPDLSRRKTCR